MAEDQTERFRDAYGEVWHIYFFAKSLDDGRGMFEPVAGHGGEEVVLDLIIESAVDKVHEPSAADIAACEDLLLEVAHGGFMLDHGHAFVIRREYESQINSDQARMDRGENKRVPWGQEKEQECGVEREVRGHEKQICSRSCGSLSQEIADARAPKTP